MITEPEKTVSIDLPKTSMEQLEFLEKQLERSVTSILIDAIDDFYRKYLSAMFCNRKV